MMNNFIMALNGYHKKGEAEITIDDFREEVNSLIGLKPTTAVNDFPVEVFPDTIQAFIKENNLAYQLPAEYYGLTILTIFAGIIGNSFELRYKNNYLVPPTLYGAIIGYSSSGKTPAMKSCLIPLYQIEEEMRKEYACKLAEWEVECESLTKGQAEPPKPVCREIIINDATIESVNGILKNNPNGLIMVMDELPGWINGMNQYRKGADEQFWLSNWSNSPVKVNRASKDTLFIPKPNVSVIGGLQPGVLKKLASGDKRDNGFIFRILFAFPADLKKPFESDHEPKESVIQHYNQFIKKAFELVDYIRTGLENEKGSFPLVLDDRSRKKYKEWANKHTKEGNESGCESTLATYGKMEQYCLRFALILKLMEEVENGNLWSKGSIVIEDKIIDAAISLTDYFIGNTFRVLNIIDQIDPLSELNEVKRITYQALPAEFTTGEGVVIAIKCGMKERTFKRFLKDKDFFCKKSHGRYSKSF